VQIEAQKAMLLELEQQRQAQLDKALAANRLYLGKLRELDRAEQEWLATAAEYDAYLDKHLPWLRNAKPIRPEDIRALPSQLRARLATADLPGLPRLIGQQLARSPAVWLAAIGAVVLHLAILLAARAICLPHGLAAAHFRWPERNLTLLRTQLNLLIWPLALAKDQVVFVPKYRCRAIYGTLRKLIGGSLRGLCQRQGVEIVEGHAMPDHLNMGWAIFMALWGALAIGGIDNFVKPYLISQGSHLPLLLIALGAFGGVAAFGFIGIFIGPPVLALGLTLVRLWTAAPPAETEAAPGTLPRP
jgi:hypothetical protein